MPEVRKQAIVFLGPSLSWRSATEYFDGVFLPPAEQGAVYGAIKHFNPSAVVLIDGAFGQVPAVRHKELLWALSQGIPVYGAASMGAIRAAELSSYGVKGHGFIYRWFRRTTFADDDEVAVAMGPIELGAPALTDGLINIRLTLRRAVREGLINDTLRRELVDAARKIHFLERSYENLFRSAYADLVEHRKDIDLLASWVGDCAIDQKRDDALGLLETLSANPKAFERDRDELLGQVTVPITSSWLCDLNDAGFDTSEL